MNLYRYEGETPAEHVARIIRDPRFVDATDREVADFVGCEVRLVRRVRGVRRMLVAARNTAQRVRWTRGLDELVVRALENFTAPESGLPNSVSSPAVEHKTSSGARSRGRDPHFERDHCRAVNPAAAGVDHRGETNRKPTPRCTATAFGGRPQGRDTGRRTKPPLQIGQGAEASDC